MQHPIEPSMPLLQMPADIDPPDTLWSRIETVHAQNKRRKMRVRLATAGLCAAAFAVVLSFGIHLPSRHRGAADVDWQARAQALEVQLRALAQDDDALQLHGSGETRAELLRVDLSLQAAYDRGAGKDELAPLWKRRSELLDALIEVRQQGLALTRI